MSIVFSPACHQCGNFTENIDGCVCKAAAYCSELCKSAHWETSHQDLCPGRESNTTYARGCELLKNAALIILKNSSLPRERVVELYKDNVVRCIGGKEIAHLGTVPTYYQRNKAEERASLQLHLPLLQRPLLLVPIRSVCKNLKRRCKGK